MTAKVLFFLYYVSTKFILFSFYKKKNAVFSQYISFLLHMRIKDEQKTFLFFAE